jgi:hypothetical protein
MKRTAVAAGGEIEVRYIVAIALLLSSCTRQNNAVMDQQPTAHDLAVNAGGDLAHAELDLAESADVAALDPGDMADPPDLAELRDQAEPLDMTAPPDLVPACQILPACASVPPFCCNGASCINGYCWNATGGPCDNNNGPLCFGPGSFCGTDHKCH